MKCQSCQSSRLQFSAEVNIHFPGWTGLTKPTIWVFPKLQVCMECGSTQFVMPPDQLSALADGLLDDPELRALVDGIADEPKSA
jgi:hypothetical protein